MGCGGEHGLKEVDGLLVEELGLELCRLVRWICWRRGGAPVVGARGAGGGGLDCAGGWWSSPERSKGICGLGSVAWPAGAEAE